MSKRIPIVHAPWLLAVATLAGGCASLDPAEDLARAETLVEDRAGAETGWGSPWDERAGDWDGTSPLSAEAAVRVALRNNRAIRREVETIVASRADYVQAHLLPNPIVNVAVGFPTDGLDGDPFTVSIIQQLSWIWTRPVEIDAAEADLRQRVLAVSDAALRLVADVRQGHAATVLAERAVALQRTNIDLIARSVALLRDRFSVGEASRLDVNRSELDRLRAESTLRDREAALGLAKRDMLALLARADEATDWSTDDALPDAVLAASSLDEERVIDLASRRRLDVAAAAAAMEGRAARLELAERGRLPGLSAGVGYEQNFSNRSGVFPSVSITPKLFDDNSARVARAASELRQAEIESDRVRQRAIAEARQAWIALRAEIDVVAAYEQDILVLAAENLDLARDAFDAGEADLTVLLEAQRENNAARIEVTDRRHGVTSQLFELERAVGGSLDAPAIEPAGALVTINPVPIRDGAEATP